MPLKCFHDFKERVQEGGIDKNEEKLKIDGTLVRKKVNENKNRVVKYTDFLRSFW